MQKRNVIHSPRLLELKRERRQVVIRKFLIIFFGLVLGLGASAYVLRLNRLNIANINVVGNKIIDTELITATIKQETSGKYLWLIPKTNIFFYPENKIKSALSEKFKRLKNIDLSIGNDHNLAVSVLERKALYTWCGEVPSQDASCYFVDEFGYIFDEAPYFSGDVYFRFYGKPDGGETTPSGAYFYKETFKNLISFKEILESIKMKPVALYVTPDEDMNIYLSNQSGGASGPEVLLKKDADYQKLGENLQAALSTEPFQSDFKKNYSKLSYIDLRFGNKVYYKFK